MTALVSVVLVGHQLLRDRGYGPSALRAVSVDAAFDGTHCASARLS